MCPRQAEQQSDALKISVIADSQRYKIQLRMCLSYIVSNKQVYYGGSTQ